MLFTLVKQDDRYQVQENGHLIYTIVQEKEGNLINILLKNPYEDVVLSFYQIKKWYHILPVLKSHEFTMYEQEEKIGELRKSKNGFDMIYHDVTYHIYGGRHAAKRSVIIFDRQMQVAEFTIEENSCTVNFSNGVFGSIYALCMYLFMEIMKENEFEEEAYLDHYQGMYMRSI